jgi:hypothetical protein
VFSKDLREAAEVGTGTNIVGNYELHDLVQLEYVVPLSVFCEDLTPNLAIRPSVSSSKLSATPSAYWTRMGKCVWSNHTRYLCAATPTAL